MCFTIDQLDRACGILLLSDTNAFIYCCKRCQNEFATGTELETHILFEHYDEKKPLESVFVNDDAYGLSQVADIGQPQHQTDSNTITFDESHIQSDVKDRSIDTIASTVIVKAESTRKSKRIRSELPRKPKIQRKIVGGTANISRISTGTHKLSEFVDTVDISVKTEKNQSLNIKGNQSEVALNETQNEAIFMDEHFGNYSSGDNSDHDDKTDMQVDESKSLKKPATTKKQPNKKRKNRWKPQKGIFYCDMCPGVTFSTLNIVKSHMKRHIANKLRKPCELCSIRPQNMEKHMRIAHIEAKPYKCDFCDETFRHNYGRVVHMRSHTGERPFLCAKCGKSFKTQDTRQKHNMQMHGEQKPHPCKECDRRFLTPWRLQEHIYSFHSDERPYSCEICGNSYSTSKYLRKHRQSHGEKIHQCRHCEKKFKTTETRRWHERTVHKTL